MQQLKKTLFVERSWMTPAPLCDLCALCALCGYMLLPWVLAFDFGVDFGVVFGLVFVLSLVLLLVLPLTWLTANC